MHDYMHAPARLLIAFVVATLGVAEAKGRNDASKPRRLRAVTGMRGPDRRPVALNRPRSERTEPQAPAPKEPPAEASAEEPAPPEEKKGEPARVEVPEAALVAPAPPPRPRRRWDVFGGGVVVFLGAYAANAGATLALGGSLESALIPFAGPIIGMQRSYGHQGPLPQSGNEAADRDANDQLVAHNNQVQAGVYAALALDVVAQAAGLAMMIGGASARWPAQSQGTRAAVTVTPAAGGVKVAF
jgi:hypothetical protein